MCLVCGIFVELYVLKTLGGHYPGNVADISTLVNDILTLCSQR